MENDYFYYELLKLMFNGIKLSYFMKYNVSVNMDKF